MLFQQYNLEFDGFWLWVNVGGVPNDSGIYCVYTCTNNQHLSLSNLIYIGESQRVHDRIVDHDRMSDWKRMLGIGQELCFSFAPISPEGARKRAEAALIYFHKPPWNKEYKNEFPFGPTDIKTSGRCEGLNSYFRVP